LPKPHWPGKSSPVLFDLDLRMKNIIFDFDGTLADSFPLVLDLFYKWSKCDPLPDKTVQMLRNKSIKEVLAYFKIPMWKVPGLLVKGRVDLGRRLAEVPLFADMDTVLKKLHSTNRQIFLMSSNSAVNVNKFLKIHKIDGYFTEVFGNAGIFGKAPVMKRIIQKYRLNPKDCYSIGDEIRDIDATKKVGITSIAVGWGYNGEQILKAHKPDYFAHKPTDLIKLLQ